MPVRKPQGDELVCTWHVCQGIENAVKNLLPSNGLEAFMPQQPRPAPLAGPGRYARGHNRRWMRKVVGGEWEFVIYGAQGKIQIWEVCITDLMPSIMDKPAFCIASWA